MIFTNERKLQYTSYWLAQSQAGIAEELLEKELDSIHTTNLDAVAQGLLIGLASFLNYVEDHDLDSHHISELKKMRK
jgi:hypothetical protein